MKNRKYSYKNNSSATRNEYAINNTKKGTNSVEVSEQSSQADDTMYNHRLMKRQALPPSDRRRSNGWLRSRPTYD